MITNLKIFLASIINNHFRLMLIISIIAIWFLTVSYDIYSFEKIAGKIVNIAFFLVISLLFNKFYLRYDEDSDKQIFSNPIALAIYLGFNAFAIAFICCN